MYKAAGKRKKVVEEEKSRKRNKKLKDGRKFSK